MAKENPPKIAEEIKKTEPMQSSIKKINAKAMPQGQNILNNIEITDSSLLFNHM